MKIKIKLYLVINGLETKKQKIYLKETIKENFNFIIIDNYYNW